MLRQIPPPTGILNTEYLSGVNTPAIHGPASIDGVMIVRTAPPAPR